MKVAFFGLVGLGSSCLKKILSAGIEVVGVVSEKFEDCKIIEQKIFEIENIHKNALKEYLKYNYIFPLCAEKNIPFFSPDNSSDLTEISKSFLNAGADVLIVCSFGKKIPRKVYEDYMLAVNIHPGSLPDNAGPSPVQWHIRNNDKTAAVTAHLLSDEIDAGDIIAKINFPLEEFETSASLNKKITEIYAPEILMRTLTDYQLRHINPKPQDLSLRKCNPKFTLDSSVINFETDTADDIVLKIRAGNYYQPAHFNYNDKTIIVWDAVVSEKKINFKPGEAAELTQEGYLIIQAIDKPVELRYAQFNDNFSPMMLPERMLNYL